MNLYIVFSWFLKLQDIPDDSERGKVALALSFYPNFSEIERRLNNLRTDLNSIAAQDLAESIQEQIDLTSQR